MATRLVIAAVTGCLLVSVTGCPAPQGRSAERTTSAPAVSDALPGRPTDASTDLPSYRGPPADAPASLGPLTTLDAAVDLSPAAPRPTARAESAVSTPAGGAYVVLQHAGPPAPQAVLATVGPVEDGYAVTGSVPLPDVVRTASLHVLDDGTVALAGDVSPQPGDVVGFGLVVVDPVEGVLRTTVVHPLREHGVPLSGRSAVSPDGRTMYLFSSTDTDRDLDDRLVAVDVATGEVVAQRDLADDVAAVSTMPIGREVHGLVARPGGGVTLVFDAAPQEGNLHRIPTLLGYDEALEPAGRGVRVTSLHEGAATQAVSAATDGTVFLLLEVSNDAWITAVPDGGGAGPLLVALTSWFFDNALWVEPAQIWGLLPSYEGAVAVDLTSGELGEPVNLGCLPDRQVRAMFPRADGAGALLLGECDPQTQMLWFVGP